MCLYVWMCVCVCALEMVQRIVAAVLRPMEISYVYGPYEADAQMAHLAREGLVDAVYSTDSDMIIHLLDWGVEAAPAPLGRNTESCSCVFGAEQTTLSVHVWL